MLKRWLTVAAALVLPCLSSAQILSDKLPPDALLYVGWQGTNALQPAYNGSHLQSVIDATDLSVLGSDAFAQSLQRLVAREDRNLARQIPSLLTAGREMLKYPSALYVAAEPAPAVALIADAGPDADALGKRITALQPRQGSPLRVSIHGRYLCLDVQAPPALFAMLDGAGGSTLAANAAFAAAMKQVDKDGACVMYCDFSRTLAFISRSSGAANADETNRVLGALGADGIRGFALSAGFSGKDWMTRAFADIAAPRQGLAKLMDAKPLSPELFASVPATASFVSASSFDIAGLLDEARASIVRYDARLGDQFDGAIAQVSRVVRADVRKDVLGQLGREWAIYSDPQVTGTGYLSLVLLNRPADAAVLESKLLDVERTLVALANQQVSRERMTLPLYDKVVGRNNVHCLALPFVSPSWCVRDGILYFGLYPQTVASAADAGAAARGGDNFARSAAFTSLQKDFPAALPSSYTFTDLPRTAAGSYNMTLFWTRYAAMADLFGLPTPAVALPPLPTLLAHLTPATSFAWNDAAGWHYRSRTPFCGAEAIAGIMNGDVSGVQTPVMVSILLPALARAREQARMVACSSNLRQIGLGIIMYSNENKGKCPPDLGTLLETQMLSMQVFVCQGSGTAIPADTLGAPLDAQARWVTEHSDYVYVAAGKKLNALGGDTVLAYDKHPHGGMVNLVFADGHVEARPQASLEMLLK